MSDPHLREPPAEVRQFAKRARDLYAALLQEGFAPEDARSLLSVPILMHLNGFRIDPEDYKNG